MDLSRLKILRGNTTIEEMADSIGVSTSAYCRYESGSRSIPDYIKVRIAERYGCTVGWLFFDEGRPPDWYKLP